MIYTSLFTNLTIINTETTAISGWTPTFTFPNGQTISQRWSSPFTRSRGNVTMTNLSYNESRPLPVFTKLPDATYP